MRTSRSIWVLALTVAMVFAVLPSSQAEIVTTPAGSGSTAQVSLAIDNDWQFESSECLQIPILATYGRADQTSILGEITVTKSDSPDTANEGTFLVLPGDPVSGQVLDTVFVCPADGTGEYTLNTTIVAIEPNSETSFNLDPLTFWVRPATSRMVGVRAVSTKGATTIRGRARADAADATGIVVLRYREPGAAKWRSLAEVLLEDGEFATTFDRVLPPKTRVSATLTECSWCSRARAVVRVK